MISIHEQFLAPLINTRVRATCAVVGAIFAAACADHALPVAPERIEAGQPLMWWGANDVGEAVALLSSLDATSPLIPPGPPTLPSAAFGELRVRLVDVAHPPGPCRTEAIASAVPGMTTLALCGRIENPAGEPLASGALVLIPMNQIDGSPLILAVLGDATRFHPPSPCTSYVLGGTVQLRSVLVDQLVSGSAVLGVRFVSTNSSIAPMGGLFPPGPPSRATNVGTAPASLAAVLTSSVVGGVSLLQECPVDLTPSSNN